MSTTKIGWARYTVIRELGSGSFGVVYMCKDLTVDVSNNATHHDHSRAGEGLQSHLPHPSTLVAVKAVPLLPLSEAEVALAMNEAAILQCLDHPNVLRYIDCFVDEEQQLCTVTEFVEGGDLSSWIKQKRATWRRKSRAVHKTQIDESKHQNVKSTEAENISGDKSRLRKAKRFTGEDFLNGYNDEDVGDISAEVKKTNLVTRNDVNNKSAEPNLTKTTISASIVVGNDSYWEDPAPLFNGSVNTVSTTMATHMEGSSLAFDPSSDEDPVGTIDQYWDAFIVLDVARQLLDALAYIHSQSILHRDIKPANIFIGADMTVKVGDFGVSKMLGSAAAAGLSPSPASPNSEALATRTFIGTPHYICPELCLGEAYSFPADVWALGIVLYELFTLELPFDASNVLALMHSISEGKYDEELLFGRPMSDTQRVELLSVHGDDYATQSEGLGVLVATVIKSMLTVDYVSRPTAWQLHHMFFGEGEAAMGRGEGSRPVSAGQSPTSRPASRGLPMSSVASLRQSAAKGADITNATTEAQGDQLAQQQQQLLSGSWARGSAVKSLALLRSSQQLPASREVSQDNSAAIHEEDTVVVGEIDLKKSNTAVTSDTTKSTPTKGDGSDSSPSPKELTTGGDHSPASPPPAIIKGSTSATPNAALTQNTKTLSTLHLRSSFAPLVDAAGKASFNDRPRPSASPTTVSATTAAASKGTASSATTKNAPNDVLSQNPNIAAALEQTLAKLGGDVDLCCDIGSRQQSTANGEGTVLSLRNTSRSLRGIGAFGVGNLGQLAPQPSTITTTSETSAQALRAKTPSPPPPAAAPGPLKTQKSLVSPLTIGHLQQKNFDHKNDGSGSVSSSTSGDESENEKKNDNTKDADKKSSDAGTQKLHKTPSAKSIPISPSTVLASLNKDLQNIGVAFPRVSSTASLTSATNYTSKNNRMGSNTNNANNAKVGLAMTPSSLSSPQSELGIAFRHPLLSLEDEAAIEQAVNDAPIVKNAEALSHLLLKDCGDRVVSVATAPPPVVTLPLSLVPNANQHQIIIASSPVPINDATVGASPTVGHFTPGRRRSSVDSISASAAAAAVVPSPVGNSVSVSLDANTVRSAIANGTTTSNFSVVSAQTPRTQKEFANELEQRISVMKRQHSSLRQNQGDYAQQEQQKQPTPSPSRRASLFDTVSTATTNPTESPTRSPAKRPSSGESPSAASPPISVPPSLIRVRSGSSIFTPASPQAAIGFAAAVAAANAEGNSISSSSFHFAAAGGINAHQQPNVITVPVSPSMLRARAEGVGIVPVMVGSASSLTNVCAGGAAAGYSAQAISAAPKSSTIRVGGGINGFVFSTSDFLVLKPGVSEVFEEDDVPAVSDTTTTATGNEVSAISVRSIPQVPGEKQTDLDETRNQMANQQQPHRVAPLSLRPRPFTSSAATDIPGAPGGRRVSKELGPNNVRKPLNSSQFNETNDFRKFPKQSDLSQAFDARPSTVNIGANRGIILNNQPPTQQFMNTYNVGQHRGGTHQQQEGGDLNSPLMYIGRSLLPASSALHDADERERRVQLLRATARRHFIRRQVMANAFSIHHQQTQQQIDFEEKELMRIKSNETIEALLSPAAVMASPLLGVGGSSTSTTRSANILLNATPAFVRPPLGPTSTAQPKQPAASVLPPSTSTSYSRDSSTAAEQTNSYDNSMGPYGVTAVYSSTNRGQMNDTMMGTTANNDPLQQTNNFASTATGRNILRLKQEVHQEKLKELTSTAAYAQEFGTVSSDAAFNHARNLAVLSGSRVAAHSAISQIGSRSSNSTPSKPNKGTGEESDEGVDERMPDTKDLPEAALQHVAETDRILSRFRKYGKTFLANQIARGERIPELEEGGKDKADRDDSDDDPKLFMTIHMSKLKTADDSTVRVKGLRESSSVYDLAHKVCKYVSGRFPALNIKEDKKLLKKRQQEDGSETSDNSSSAEDEEEEEVDEEEETEEMAEAEEKGEEEEDDAPKLNENTPRKVKGTASVNNTPSKLTKSPSSVTPSKVAKAPSLHRIRSVLDLNLVYTDAEGDAIHISTRSDWRYAVTQHLKKNKRGSPMVLECCLR